MEHIQVQEYQDNYQDKTTIWLPMSSWPEPDSRENNSTSDIIPADDSSWIEGGTREPPEMASPDVAWQKSVGFENGFGSDDLFSKISCWIQSIPKQSSSKRIQNIQKHSWDQLFFVNGI